MGAKCPSPLLAFGELQVVDNRTYFPSSSLDGHVGDVNVAMRRCSSKCEQFFVGRECDCTDGLLEVFKDAELDESKAIAFEEVQAASLSAKNQVLRRRGRATHSNRSLDRKQRIRDILTLDDLIQWARCGSHDEFSPKNVTRDRTSALHVTPEECV